MAAWSCIAKTLVLVSYDNWLFRYETVTPAVL